MVDYDLIGASNTDYCEDISNIAQTKGYCWSGWTYPIARHRVAKLKQEKFRLLIYTSEGEITHIFFCDDLEYDSNKKKTPEKTHTNNWDRQHSFRTWLKVYKVDIISFDITNTMKLSDNNPVMPQGLQNRFSYVYPV